MLRHVVDTDIYIDLIRSGSTLPALQAIYERGTAGLYFSSVVAGELWAGARDSAAKAAVKKLVTPFVRHGRILTPTHRDWTLAGKILGRILERFPSRKNSIARLSNDCLLAVSAQFAGATVYTQNADDFRLIQNFCPFSLVILRNN